MYHNGALARGYYRWTLLSLRVLPPNSLNGGGSCNPPQSQPVRDGSGPSHESSKLIAVVSMPGLDTSKDITVGTRNVGLGKGWPQ